MKIYQWNCWWWALSCRRYTGIPVILVEPFYNQYIFLVLLESVTVVLSEIFANWKTILWSTIGVVIERNIKYTFAFKSTKYVEIIAQLRAVFIFQMTTLHINLGQYLSITSFLFTKKHSESRQDCKKMQVIY